MKGRINVSKNRELRGGPMYAVATLFCLPLPLQFLVGIVIGLSAAKSNTAVDQSSLLGVALACTGIPILAALVIGFSMSKPKIAPMPPPRAQGFEVLPVNAEGG